MKIYWIKAQAPHRVLALAKHLGLPFESVAIDPVAGGLRDAAYVALNPNKKAPTLVDGDLVLWESSAIMAHLCLKAGSDLWPAHNPTEQIDVIKWLSWNDGHWAPAVGPFYLEHIVKAKFNLGPPDLARLEKATPELIKFAKVLDAHLKGRDHPACNRLTIADFQLASMATHWRDAAMPFADMANIVRWLDGMDRLPAWREPWPKA